MRGFRELDRILRGSALAPGARFEVPLGPLVVVNVLLAALYGACMGFFGVFGRAEPDFRFLLADALKVPLLFLLTLVVTFPSLYVFNALIGSRLGALDLARVLTAALGVHVAVLAAFGPIVAFFSVTTTSYPFILLLNVAVFTLGAGFAIAFLLRTVDRLALPSVPAAAPVPVPAAPTGEPGSAPESPVGAPPERAPEAPESAVVADEPEHGSRRERDVRADRPERPVRAMPVRDGRVTDKKVRAVFYGWLVVFALVGGQMSWVLRPFIGMPYRDFAWFRAREGSFFEGVWKSLRLLLGG
jgi:hypothetical protein